MSHILIVEDEVKLAEVLRDYLQQNGYQLTLIHHGDEASQWLRQHTPDLILLDLMLPGKDGMTLCREVRQQSDTPIIMTTAKVEEIDRLLGLELGADDYICKPYSPREVVARVKAVLRRSQPAEPLERAPGKENELHLHEQSNKVSFAERQIELTQVEFNLLKTLYAKPGHIFSRDRLIDAIYSDRRVVSDRTIDSHIKKLRKKMLELNPDEEMIRSVYGAGYKFE